MRVTVLRPDQDKHFRAADWLPALPSILASLLGIYVVHRLTRGREREKAALELYRAAGEQLEEVKTAAFSAWTTRAGAERQRTIAETKWRLQRLGATVNRLGLLTNRKRWSLTKPFRRDVSVQLRNEMTPLRRAITADPFDDPTRRADAKQKVGVESAIGEFQDALDRKLYDWLS